MSLNCCDMSSGLIGIGGDDLKAPVPSDPNIQVLNVS